VKFILVKFQIHYLLTLAWFTPKLFGVNQAKKSLLVDFKMASALRFDATAEVRL